MVHQISVAVSGSVAFWQPVAKSAIEASVGDVFNTQACSPGSPQVPAPARQSVP